MKNKTKALVLIATALTAMACTEQKAFTEKELTGKWIEVLPEGANYVQGICMEEGGKASSIGMATLVYERWSILDKNQIVLKGKSIGNGQTIEFSDTLSIVSLQNDTLTLGKGDEYRVQYARENSNAGDENTGYTYSEILKKKIKASDEGVKLYPTMDKGAAYAVFTSDSAKAELLMTEGNVVLERNIGKGGDGAWISSDKEYMIEKWEGTWLVSKGGALVYSSPEAKNNLNSTFVSDKGKEIGATFYLELDAAQLDIDGSPALLKQYRTGSGYGYANKEYDLRGKGEEATLTRTSDGKKIQLKEKR